MYGSTGTMATACGRGQYDWLKTMVQTPFFRVSGPVFEPHWGCFWVILTLFQGQKPYIDPTGVPKRLFSGSPDPENSHFEPV